MAKTHKFTIEITGTRPDRYLRDEFLVLSDLQDFMDILVEEDDLQLFGEYKDLKVYK